MRHPQVQQKEQTIFWVETENIKANPFQPRKEFDENKLKELADSIKQYGILQPLVVVRQEKKQKKKQKKKKKKKKKKKIQKRKKQERKKKTPMEKGKSV